MQNYKQIWKGILNIGRKDTMHYLDMQRNAILNAVLVSTIFLILVITIIYTILGFNYNLIPLIALPVCILALWSNYKSRYDLAKAISFFGFLIAITIWSFVLRRCYNELLFVTLTCGSASILTNRKLIFLAMITCSLFYMATVVYNNFAPFVPDPTINYFVIKSIMAFCNGRYLVFSYLGFC